MIIDNKAAQTFLYEYVNNTSPTGFESSGQKLWLKYLKPYIDEWDLDTYGTAYATINPGKEFRIVIEAHADEISWFVNYISDKGMIGVVRNGGSDHVIAPSKRVNIHTEKGVVEGVFGWPAIHLRKRKDVTKLPSVENIFIDVGAKDKEEVLMMGIHVGCVITFQDEMTYINDKYYTGRSLDNKIGGFSIAQVARLLKENKKSLPYTLYLVNAVQEEVGLRGALMIADKLQPNAAIVTDVTHDTTTPHIKKSAQGEIVCGNGPSLAYAPSTHYKLLDHIITTAKKNKIPFQRSAYSRGTGTDLDAFAYTGGGIPSVLVSMPMKYMHTTVEMVHKDDIENQIKLVYESLLKITPDMSFKYFEKV